VKVREDHPRETITTTEATRQPVESFRDLPPLEF
jgi:hypothetical protein